MSTGLSKSERLRNKKEFRRVYHKGKRVSGKCIDICFLENVEGKWRLGLIVSKRIGKAVTRNRVKRILREIFRNHKQDFIPGSDVVLVAKKGIEKVKFREMETDIKNILGK